MGYSTPAEWLPYLTKGLDAQVTENSKLRAFAAGTQPGPEMSKKARASWIRFQRFASVVYARLIAESLSSRITPTAVVIGAGDAADAGAKANAIWRRSRLDVVLADAVEDTLIVGRAFLCAAVDSFGRAIVTFEDADRTFAVADPLDPTTLRAAVKVWRDEVTGRDYARVWTLTGRQDFIRTSTRVNSKALRTTNSGGWEPLADEIVSDGVPLTMLVNRGSASEFGHVLNLLDRISLGILNRLVIVAYEAFKLRYIKGLGLDPDNPDDVAKAEALLDVSPGSILDLGDDAELHEMSSTDFRPLLEAVKDDIRELAAITSTPLSALIPDGANQSAEGALAAREAQILKALDRQRRFGPVIEGVLLKALRMELGATFDQDVEVSWMNPALSTANERTNAALQAKAVGVPFLTLATDYLGHTPEQAKAMQEAREDESLIASLAPLTPAA
ncbi:phage portal protein [Microbacterium sp. HA-8]|uniref:phage portal protein n=1 Tax=Microbacterium sp. HA-8 TaxID=3234200 RepID=UPI0038F6C627